MKLSMKEAEQAAKTAEKFPWGTSIVVALLSTLIVYLIMSKQVSWAMKRADDCQKELTGLTTRIMIKNNIIEKQTDTIYVQREIIQNVDSINKIVTESSINKLLKMKK